MRKEKTYDMKELTDERRDTMSMDIYNISRRIRQITNGMVDGEPAKIKLIEYITQLNDIGTEIGGGRELMIGKVLRS